MDAAIQFIKRETVLTVSGILALISVIFVPVTSDYLEYIDFRVLALLFCLMGVMAGLQEIGAFSRLGCGMLKKTRSTGQLSFVLVFPVLLFEYVYYKRCGSDYLCAVYYTCP